MTVFSGFGCQKHTERGTTPGWRVTDPIFKAFIRIISMDLRK
jgi:hypothetical protein